MTSPYLCTSNPCSYDFTVTNEGDAAAEAVLHVSFLASLTGPTRSAP